MCHAYETAFSCTAWTRCYQPAHLPGSETEHFISFSLLHHSRAELLNGSHFCSSLAYLDCLNPVHSFCLNSGEVGRMDSDRMNAIAFSMGVKRSKIVLPWEEAPLSEIFGMKKPLIPPAAWVPEPGASVGATEVDRTVSKGHLMGKPSWTTKTTMIPWPVFEEARLSKVLELWRVVILDSYKHTALGRQIHVLMSGEQTDEGALKEVIKDALCGKSISTLKTRVASITSFGRWKKSVMLPEEASIFHISEELAYRYICELRKEGAPRSRATRFLEAVGILQRHAWGRCGCRLSIFESERCLH